jgi:hypothetical protein
MEDVLQVPVSRDFRRSMMIHSDRFLELIRLPLSSQEAVNLAARFAIREYVMEASHAQQTARSIAPARLIP